MDPLEFYGQMQPLIEQDVMRYSKEQIDKWRFAVAPVQAHVHNGVDSLSIPFENLDNAAKYNVISYYTLTSAQVLALNSTPVTIVPAQGTKTLIIVESITARLNFSTTAYAGGNNLQFRYTDGSGTKVTADMGFAFLNSAVTAYDHAPGVTTEFTPVAGAPIVAFVPTANPTTGNSVINLTIKYRLVPYA